VLNAPNRCDSEKKLTITHPFHPLNNQEFEFVVRRHNWSEDTIHCHDDKGCVKSFPTQWTSRAEIDPFVLVSEGRSLFHFSDLHSLCELVSKLSNQLNSAKKGGEGV